MNILVNGDSFTHERHFARENKPELTWAYSLKAKNIALGGSSNDRIFHTTIEHLNENQVDALVLGWTHWSRYWLTGRNGLYFHIGTNYCADDNLKGFDNNDKNVHKPIQEFYMKNCLNEFLNFKRFTNYYLHLQEYCKLKNIKFLNFMSTQPLPDTNEIKLIASEAHMNKSDKELEAQGIKYNSKILTDALSKFDKECWVNKEVGFCFNNWVDNNKLDRWHDGYHPGQQASNQWGELIKAEL